MCQAEARHMGRVAELRCIVCKLLGREQETRTEVHHIREGQGMSQRASAFLTLPVCSDDHRGPSGIHGDRSMLRVLKMTELDLLAETIRELTQ